MSSVYAKSNYRLLRAFAIAFFVSLVIVGCGNNSADIAAEDAVNIRIRNETGFDFDRAWLGRSPTETAATFTTRWAGIADGEVSEYLPVEPVIFNYDVFDVTGDGQRWGTRDFDPHTFLGVDELSPGVYYTFTLTNDGDPDLLTLADVSIDKPSDD